MDSRWLGVIVLIIIVVLGGWYVFSHPAAAPAPVAETPAVTDQTTTTTSTTTTTTTMPLAPVTVTYTDKGFTPSSISVAQGQSVMWVNQSSKQMWVASGMHPTHLVYDGTSKDAHCAASYTGPTPFDECVAVPAGQSYTFAFTKAGTWGYHNHANAADFGKVVVAAASGGGVTASTSVNVNVR